MANDYMALDERIGRLEETVAKEFFGIGGRMDGLDRRMDGLDLRMDGLDRRMDGLEGRMDGLEGRMGRLEDRMDALDSKFDVVSERLEGKIQTVLDHLEAFRGEMRRTTDAIVQEHRADRRLMHSRFTTRERQRKSSKR